MSNRIYLSPPYLSGQEWAIDTNWIASVVLICILIGLLDRLIDLIALVILSPVFGVRYLLVWRKRR